VIEAKDLPPEVQVGGGAEATAASAPEAPAQPPAAVAPAAMPATRERTVPGTASASSWLADLERQARQLLEAGAPEVWDALTRQFEAQLIQTALQLTRGRRIEAAQRLGIGRNTITRKIQELGLDD
jgi:two-component system nitrogen regulation response regulator GlnG